MALSERICTDRRVTEIYEGRKAEFIRLHQEKIRSASGCLGRFKYVWKLDESARKLLSVPEAKTALKISSGLRKGAELVAGCALTCAVAALCLS